MVQRVELVKQLLVAVVVAVPQLQQVQIVRDDPEVAAAALEGLLPFNSVAVELLIKGTQAEATTEIGAVVVAVAQLLMVVNPPTELKVRQARVFPQCSQECSHSGVSAVRGGFEVPLMTRAGKAEVTP